MFKIFIHTVLVFLLLYIVKRPFIQLIKFIFDNIMGELFWAIGEWLEPFIRILARHQVNFTSKLNMGRVVGSSLLFALMLFISLVNYYLIFYGMELLLPGETGLGAYNLSGAGLASVTVMLVEIAIGFLILEILGATDLLGWHTISTNQKRFLLIFLIVLFLMIVFAEVGVAMKRIYEVEGGVSQTGGEWAQTMSKLPYWITGIIAFVIPIFNAMAAYSLRDIVLIIGWIGISIFLIIFSLLNLIHKRLYFLVTHIDDFLEKLLQFFIIPIEILICGIQYVLIKLKFLKYPTLLFLISLSSFSYFLSCTPKTKHLEHNVVVILMDNSGSFRNYLNRAVDHSIQLVQNLKPGDHFFLFLIDKESLRQDRAPIQLKLPVSPTTILTRKFKSTINKEKKKTIQEIIKIKNLNRAQYTDLVGAIERAASFLNTPVYKNWKKYLIIYSDMQDTRNRELFEDARLDNVMTYILFADINEKTRKAIQLWQKKLMELGAMKVEIYNPDQVVTMDFNFN